MKQTILITVLFLISFFGNAQNTQKDELQIIQTLFGMGKKELIASYIKAPVDKQDAFWATYDQYETKRQALGTKRFEIINDYANNYFQLTDTKANELVGDVILNNVQLEKLNYVYFKKFKKLLGGVEAAKLIQLEVYIQSQIKSAMQNTIPFIGEIKIK